MPERKAPPKEEPAKQAEEAPAQSQRAAPPAVKPALVAPKPLILLRYRPRTFPVHIAEGDAGAFESVLGKYGFSYSSTVEGTPVSGVRWYAYTLQYRWYEKNLDTPEQLTAAAAELEGLWDRFGLRVEVSQE